jgi:hypothetical protein
MSSPQIKVVSLLLGVLMFMFGFLKFFEPFHGWFVIQIQQSHLPQGSILAGKLGEMVVGCLFVLPWLRQSLTTKSRDQILLVACMILVTQGRSPSCIAHCFVCLEGAASGGSQRCPD